MSTTYFGSDALNKLIDLVKTALGPKADDSNVVHKTGDETVVGSKTFTGTTIFSNANNDAPVRVKGDTNLNDAYVGFYDRSNNNLGFIGVKSDNLPYFGYSNSDKRLALLDEVIEKYDGAGAHNSIYRGKYLGDTYTNAQKTAISLGNFNDLYIGDYWTIGNVNYRIAAFDYWLNTGNSSAKCTDHHVVIVPDTNLYTAKMNDSNTTNGGYAGSKMWTENLASAKTTINSAFGSANILSHKEYLTTSVANGKPSTGGWNTSSVDLMNERMVYGASMFEPANDGSTIPHIFTIDKSQLPLFALDPSRISNNNSWWLRDVASSTSFAEVSSAGYGDVGSANTSLGVRPVFAIY